MSFRKNRWDYWHVNIWGFRRILKVVRVLDVAIFAGKAFQSLGTLTKNEFVHCDMVNS